MIKEENKDLAYWKANAEEDYMQVPISVLRYITELEAVVKNCYIPAVISWVAVSERLPLVDGNKQLFVWDGYQYEIARFNEWGFHYGTRNTQDCLFNVVFWAECPEPPYL